MTSQELRNSLKFPKDRHRSRAISSPFGPGLITVNGGPGPFPEFGNSMRTVLWCVMEDGYVYDPLDIQGSLPDDGENVDIQRRTRSLVLAI
jgi:hypothetical protein